MEILWVVELGGLAPLWPSGQGVFPMSPSDEPAVLDYQSAQSKPDLSSEKRVRRLAYLVAAVTAVTNGTLIYSASSGDGWGALGIALMVGPIVNVVLIVMTLVTRPLVKHHFGGASTSLYVLAGVLTPIAAIFIDAICIFSMDLHGC
jgi:hypothetical protein